MLSEDGNRSLHTGLRTERRRRGRRLSGTWRCVGWKVTSLEWRGRTCWTSGQRCAEKVLEELRKSENKKVGAKKCIHSHRSTQWHGLAANCDAIDASPLHINPGIRNKDPTVMGKQ